MKKSDQQKQDELEQFQAYGEYSYAYRHAADQHRKHRQRDREGSEPQTDDPAMMDGEIPMEEPAEPELTPQERAQIRSRSITGRLIFLLAAALIAIIVLQGTVFRLKTVYVIGNVKKTAQQVAAASGLVKGLNIFSISEDDVREHLSADHTIVFVGLQKDYPSTIYLYISEREAVASMQWLGLMYTLDGEGVVMDENNSTALPSGMPAVTGLQVTNVHVGQNLKVRNQEQMLAYQDIMKELKLQYYQDQVKEINLSDTENLYLMITNGISVRLGNRTHIRAKIGAVRTDMAYLIQLGKTSGILDVSIPEDAKYRPES